MDNNLKIIDLSITIEECTLEPFPVKIKRLDHVKGASYLGRDIIFSKHKPLLENLKNLFRYLCGTRKLTKNDFPNGEFISNERITASVHTGTHLDAPYHFGSCCERRPAKTIDQIPLEWCYGDGVVLNLSHKEPGDSILPGDIEEALTKIKYKIKPYDIVLIQTNADKYWGTKEYYFKFPGMSQEATAWLVERGVKIIGIDSLGFDRPFDYMLQAYFRTKDNKYLWPAHIYGRTKEYCHLERLANLDQIPKPYDFKVVCFPIKIKDVGASWIRPVAIIENNERR
ncbi:MAG: cyclase family protein [bacterium]